MTQIFVSHTQDDAACAEQIRKGFEAKGYSVWREPTSLSMESILYPRTIENVILSSAAAILVWSSSAAASEWVQRHILFAQRLKKLIVPVVVDGTDLPPTLIVDTTITGQVPYADVVKQLPPDFPQPDSIDSVIKLSEQAAHEFIRERKEAIDHAAEMLKQHKHREEVLAILEYLAHNDLMMGVREKAQEVLDADARKATPPPPFLHPDDSRHIIGVRCKQCGQVTYFDRRRICSAQSQLVRRREKLAGKELDKFDLPCEKCGHIIPTRVDCEAY
jgi:TIR domain